MSTKTNYKRVALVAVAELGLGVLTSVAPANAAANATIDRDTYSYGSGFNVCAAPTDDDASNFATYGNTRQVGEVLSTGSVTFTGGGGTDILVDAGDTVTLTISGPAYWSSFTEDGTTPATTTSTGSGGLQIKSTYGSSAVRLPTAATMSFTGVGAVQVTIALTDVVSASSTVTSTLETYTFTVSSSCNKGTLSVANSFVRTVYADSDTTPASATKPSSNTTDGAVATDSTLAESAAYLANGGTGYVAARAMDSSSTALIITSSATWGATATNGAIVSLDGSFSPASSAVYATSSNGYALVYVKQGAANKDKAVETVVTITYNGTELGKRTLKFTGAPAKITIDSANAGVGGSESDNALLASYEITDAAGNLLTSNGAGSTGATKNNAPVLATAGIVVDPTQSQVTAVSNISDEASGFQGAFGWTCGVGSGSAKVYLYYINAVTLAKIASNTHDAACAYGVRKYEASLDKASYAPGEIATLTITATDKNGKAVYDYSGTAGAGADLGTLAKSPEITLPQMTAVSTPTWSNEFVSGKKTYKFTVGTTEGSYSGIVNLPLHNSSTYGVAAKTVAYKVAAASTGAVSNADVLKAIVSLIASINKQIAALQKALLKK